MPELFPSNDLGVMPLVTVTGQLSPVGANQLFNIDYKNYTVTDSFTWQRGTHAFKVGGLMTFEQKNENAANETQGNFTFGAGGGRTAFHNFLSGNADGLCGNACTYSEAQNDVTEHLRFNRYEMFAQDSWKPRAERHGRLRRPLLALSADHRRQQRPDQLPRRRPTSPPTRRSAPTRRAR